MSSSISPDLTPQLFSPEPALGERAPDSDASESSELSPGSQLGNYVVHACIGRGAMATVYRAEHCLLNKQVALKVMASSLHASAEARQRFLREARAIAAIQHPNVVTIADAGLVDGTPYLVMELLQGADLEQHLERHGPFSGQDLAALALPLVAALAAAHDAGVIHRDLKPGNIFLSRGAGGELVPKLLDFGISKFASPAGPHNLAVTAFDQLMGSPLYLPPEALQGSRELTSRSDQYSLGVVLYECITGQAPFFREDLVPLLNAISEGSCPAPTKLRPETPQAMEDLILRAMRVEPGQRFAHIRELGSALLPLADVRTRHLWAPTFASASAVVVVPGALAAVAESPPLVSPRLRSSARRASAARSTRGSRRAWGTLALCVSGAALLALAFERARAVHVEQGPRFAAQTLESAEPALAPVAVVRELLHAPGPSPTAGSDAARDARPVDAPLTEGSSADAAAAAKRAVASRAVPRGGSALRGVRAVSGRGRGGETDAELGKLFFSGAASQNGKTDRARREPAAQVAVEAPVRINEAPLFD